MTAKRRNVITNGTSDNSQSPQTEQLAIWSLVLGVLSLTCFGPLTAIPAIICGHLARKKVKESSQSLTGSGMALAGIIMGYFLLAVIVLGILAAIILPILLPQVQQ